MKAIALTKKKVALVDEEDCESLSKLKWHAMQCNSGLWYSARSFQTSEGTRLELMHRRLCPKFERVDHEDGDGLNNQKGNLRNANQMQNCHNRRMMSTNTSGFKGLQFNKTDK